MSNARDGRRRGLARALGPIVLIGFLAIGGYFLWTEHRAHVATAIPYLPFILLAACALMHLFHGGHGGHAPDEPDHGEHRRDPDGGPP